MKIRELIVVAVCSAFLASCSTAVVEKIEAKLGSDLRRTIEIADKYGKPEVAKCGRFLLASLEGQDSAQAKIKALLAEPTDGILSKALIAAIVADLGRELAQGNNQEFEKAFRENCNAVAGDLMMKLLKDAATIGKRG